MGAFKHYLDSLDPFHNSHLLIVEGTWSSSFDHDKGATTHVHRFNVGEHDVNVYFKNPENGQNHAWNVDYSINGSYHKAWSRGYKTGNRPTESETQQIMHGVAGTVHHFIAKHKPQVLYLHANVPEKEKLYQTFGQHLAKHYGGKMNVANQPDEIHGTHEVSVHF